MIKFYRINSPEAKQIFAQDETTLADLAEGCKMLKVSQYTKQVFFLPKEQELTPDSMKSSLGNGHWFIFYEQLDKYHPQYKYYSVIGFCSPEIIDDVRIILKAKKLKAFL